MRDKFSELVNLGVAPARYKEFIKEEPSSLASIDDNMMITYNNYWGVATDTHMSKRGDQIVITGSLLRSERKTNCLLDSCGWGDITFTRILPDVYNLRGFLAFYNYTWHRDILNGDWVLTIIPKEEENTGVEMAHENLNEAKDEWNPSLKGHKDAYNTLVKWYDKQLRYMNNDEIMDLLQYFISDIESGTVETIK